MRTGRAGMSPPVPAAAPVPGLSGPHIARNIVKAGPGSWTGMKEPSMIRFKGFDTSGLLRSVATRAAVSVTEVA